MDSIGSKIGSRLTYGGYFRTFNRLRIIVYISQTTVQRYPNTDSVFTFLYLVFQRTPSLPSVDGNCN